VINDRFFSSITESAVEVVVEVVEVVVVVVMAVSSPVPIIHEIMKTTKFLKAEVIYNRPHLKRGIMGPFTFFS